MFNGKKVLALIPARGGSKRLPRKNLLSLDGKPLVNWSIDLALANQFIDCVILSTDDPEIVSVVDERVFIPELRPDYLSTDLSTTLSVLLYTIEKFGQGFDILMVLQPTSPIRKQEHINEALSVFCTNSAFSVVSVTQCEHPPIWSNTLPENGMMDGFIKSEGLKRSQDLDIFYRLNGSIYIYDIHELLKVKHVNFTENTYAYKMDNMYSIDIDNKIDFEMVEFFVQKYQLGIDY
ncbi:acylneuraminate cytidylyltransferase family protein [Shewanella phaeophyticola]|uniref:Acylneuraminate cytidylyltransferase family protein n=1 Tax=Shewanella phaeophyticola TaxID=2978345 RepID=A0ABT2P7N0_9GAMM|nr:acylneuraminate cytidylyltransferase family protein [Shewanella sp. KJ10-1]MCT8987247.1 acylneuraminate cytidylyltransferase family protein [Shewanella sp. KJ10-1]MCT8988653.1 acylneuraminate cytidylyltransferase family protein [Shewanella sp. KJ10-1]